MPRYRAKSALFVDGSRVRPGQEFNSDSPPSDQWELIEDKPAPKAGKPAPAAPTVPTGAPQTFEQMTDEQLRDFIETRSRTRKRPGDKVERPQLLEIAGRIAKPDGDA